MSDKSVRICLADLDTLMQRAFGALRAIDLSDDEIQLVNRINAVRRTASSRTHLQADPNRSKGLE